jgi:hypothetical protein
VVRVISRIAIISGKVAVPLCLLAPVGYGVLYFEAPWLESLRISKFDTRVSIVPAELPSKAEAPLSSESIEWDGFTFQLPNNVDRTFRGDHSLSVHFLSGGWLRIENVARGGDVLGLTMRDKSSQKVLGEEVLRSRFSLMQAAMSATPEQVKWWRFRASANQNVDFLLIMKFSALSQVHSLHFATIRPIYRIASGKLHGFQIGNPDVLPYEAHVDLFDAADRHFALDVAGPEGHGRVLTQAEINAMVGSIRLTPGRE